MFAAFEWMVAGRYMRARRKDGFISVIAGFSLLGIALGVATLIIVMSVMNGFRAELLGRILGVNGHISVVSQAPDGLAGWEELAGKLRRVPDVTGVVPIAEGQVMAASEGHAAGALARGMRLEDLKARVAIADHIVAGSIDGFARGEGVLVGARLARHLGIAPGGQITLISPRGTKTAFGTVPRLKAYPVSGLFEVGMFEYDNSVVLMPLLAAQSYFRLDDRISQLEVMVTNPDAVARPRAAVSMQLSPRQGVFDWQQANRSFFNALQVERNVMFLILTLIILVAAFNIVSGLIMLVKDKGADIAILRTMGTTRGAIMRIFFIAGASIGVVGTTVGTLLGLLFCANIESIRQLLQAMTGTELFSPEIYFLSQLPTKVDSDEVITVVGMAFFLSILATIYPSWRAARTDPIEALRYE
ncbi:MAG: lipoprotein-releasing ABC transporter permease subunit [Alphaproteobacteria bacterium]|nr:lipoprotein-releasing ABC transporter permease subunit [Alphaproteobacteria bacterium]